MRTGKILPLVVPVLLLLVFGPALLSRGPLYGYDTLGELYFWHEWAYGEILQGTFPHWNPLFLAGHPFHAAAVVSLLYPPNLLHLALPTGTAINWLFFLHFVLAGLGSYALLVRLGRSAAAAAVGSTAFVLSEAMTSRILAGEIPQVFVLAWLPLSLLVVEWAMGAGRARRLLWLAPIVCLQILAGHLQYLLLCSIALFAYFAAAWVSRARSGLGSMPLWRPPVALAAAFLLGAALAGPQVLPTAQLARLSARAAGMPPTSLDPGISLPASALPRFLLPDLHGNEYEDGYRGESVRVQTPLYMGVLPVLLALVGVGVGSGARGRAYFAALALGAILFSMGRATPLWRVAAAVVPGLASFRIPSRALFLVALPLAALASIGFDLLLGGAGPSAARRRRGAPLCLLAASLATASAAAILWAQAPGPAYRLLVLSIASALLAVAAGWLRVPGRWLSPLAILFLACDLVPLHAGCLRAVPPRVLEPTPEIRAVLARPRPDASPPRVWTALSNRRAPLSATFLASYGIEGAISEVEINRAMPAGVAGVSGEIGLIPARTVRFMGTEGSYGVYLPRDPRLLDWLGVRFAVLDADTIPDDPSLVRVEGPAAAGRALYENADALPRAFVARRASFPGSQEAVFSAIRARWPDPREEVLLEGEGPIDPGPSAGRARIVRYGTLATTIEAALESPGWLVLTDPAYPGWEATADGAAAPILVAHGLFRAVHLPAGSHTVELVFRPILFLAGLAVSLAGALACAGLAIVLRRSGTRQGPAA